MIENDGTVLHDITAPEFHGDARAIDSVAHDDRTARQHEEANVFHAAAAAGGTTELIFTATEAGEFKLFCSVPGHEALGMTAALIVTACRRESPAWRMTRHATLIATRTEGTRRDTHPCPQRPG